MFILPFNCLFSYIEHYSQNRQYLIKLELNGFGKIICNFILVSATWSDWYWSICNKKVGSGQTITKKVKILSIILKQFAEMFSLDNMVLERKLLFQPMDKRSSATYVKACIPVFQET